MKLRLNNLTPNGCERCGGWLKPFDRSAHNHYADSCVTCGWVSYSVAPMPLADAEESLARDAEFRNEAIVETARAATGYRRHHSATLAEWQVIDIYRLTQEGELSQTQISERFGIAKSAVTDIAKQKTWKRLTDSIPALEGA